MKRFLLGFVFILFFSFCTETLRPMNCCPAQAKNQIKKSKNTVEDLELAELKQKVNKLTKKLKTTSSINERLLLQQELKLIKQKIANKTQKTQSANKIKKQINDLKGQISRYQKLQETLEQGNLSPEQIQEINNQLQQLISQISQASQEVQGTIQTLGSNIPTVLTTVVQQFQQQVLPSIQNILPETNTDSQVSLTTDIAETTTSPSPSPSAPASTDQPIITTHTTTTTTTSVTAPAQSEIIPTKISCEQLVSACSGGFCPNKGICSSHYRNGEARCYCKSSEPLSPSPFPAAPPQLRPPQYFMDINPFAPTIPTTEVVPSQAPATQPTSNLQAEDLTKGTVDIGNTLDCSSIDNEEKFQLCCENTDTLKPLPPACCKNNPTLPGCIVLGGQIGSNLGIGAQAQSESDIAITQPPAPTESIPTQPKEESPTSNTQAELVCCETPIKNFDTSMNGEVERNLVTEEDCEKNGGLIVSLNLCTGSLADSNTPQESTTTNDDSKLNPTVLIAPLLPPLICCDRDRDRNRDTSTSESFVSTEEADVPGRPATRRIRMEIREDCERALGDYWPAGLVVSNSICGEPCYSDRAKEFAAEEFEERCFNCCDGVYPAQNVTDRINCKVSCLSMLDLHAAICTNDLDCQAGLSCVNSRCISLDSIGTLTSVESNSETKPNSLSPVTETSTTTDSDVEGNGSSSTSSTSSSTTSSGNSVKEPANECTSDNECVISGNAGKCCNNHCTANLNLGSLACCNNNDCSNAPNGKNRCCIYEGAGQAGFTQGSRCDECCEDSDCPSDKPFCAKGICYESMPDPDCRIEITSPSEGDAITSAMFTVRGTSSALHNDIGAFIGGTGNLGGTVTLQPSVGGGEWSVDFTLSETDLDGLSHQIVIFESANESEYDSAHSYGCPGRASINVTLESEESEGDSGANEVGENCNEPNDAEKCNSLKVADTVPETNPSPPQNPQGQSPPQSQGSTVPSNTTSQLTIADADGNNSLFTVNKLDSNPISDSSVFTALGNYFEITAISSDAKPPFTVTANYSNTELPSSVSESQLKLLHGVNGAWVDVTTSIDINNKTITGTVQSLSPFAIGSASATLSIPIPTPLVCCEIRVFPPPNTPNPLPGFPDNSINNNDVPREGQLILRRMQTRDSCVNPPVGTPPGSVIASDLCGEHCYNAADCNNCCGEVYPENPTEKDSCVDQCSVPATQTGIDKTTSEPTTTETGTTNTSTTETSTDTEPPAEPNLIIKTDENCCAFIDDGTNSKACLPNGHCKKDGKIGICTQGMDGCDCEVGPGNCGNGIIDDGEECDHSRVPSGCRNPEDRCTLEGCQCVNCENIQNETSFNYCCRQEEYTPGHPCCISNPSLPGCTPPATEPPRTE